MKQYYQVNWINGMKITSDHFIDLEKHFIYRIGGSIKGIINNVSYGLFPGGDKKDNTLRFNLLLNEQKIRVLNDFTVLSPGGILAHVPANMEFPLSRPVSDAVVYYLVLDFDPYSRISFGEIREHESPLRYPYAIPEYKFHLIVRTASSLHTLGDTIVPLARFSGTALVPDDTYIPPCTSVQSHSVLTALCDDFTVSLKTLEREVFKLLSEKTVSNLTLLTNLVNYLTYNKTAVDWYIPYQPPVFLFEKINLIAKVFQNSIDWHASSFRSDMKGLVSSVADSLYDHMEISSTVTLSKTFLDKYSELLPIVGFGV